MCQQYFRRMDILFDRGRHERESTCLVTSTTQFDREQNDQEILQLSNATKCISLVSFALPYFITRWSRQAPLLSIIVGTLLFLAGTWIRITAIRKLGRRIRQPTLWTSATGSAHVQLCHQLSQHAVAVSSRSDVFLLLAPSVAWPAQQADTALTWTSFAPRTE